MVKDDESFATRWLHRKAAAKAPGEPRAPEARLDAPQPKSDTDFDDVDFGALDLNSDFTRFMRDNVPDSVRNRALQMLWTSSDVIGKPDDLDDFLEDFTEQAKGLPPELVQSGYAIGAGFVEKNIVPEDETAEAREQDAALDESHKANKIISESERASVPAADASLPRETS